MLEEVQNSYRYERKFFINNIDGPAIESMLQNTLFGFSEMYPSRWVNNIYFDYLDFRNYMDNVAGNMYRVKSRIRWYGDLWQEIEQPKLELKIKQGLVGAKKIFDLNAFNLKRGIDANNIKQVITDSLSSEQVTAHNLKEQNPVMLNRYRRKYFQSLDKKFRMTVDDHQSFYKFNKYQNSFLQKVQDSSNTIIELKYTKENDRLVSNITNLFPFRVTKSSKYARGIEMFYG